MKVQHQQVQQDRRQTLTEFIKEGEVNLKHGEQYKLTDMAVTSDNKLLLCNHSDDKVDIYKDYKTYEDKISFTSYHVNFINSRRHVMNLLVCFLNDCYLFS
jgi:hypothetical protein